MSINKFVVLVARVEGKKKQVNIAQIREILAVVNKLTFGTLYYFIRYVL